jgi:hypothetical protein
MVGVSASDLIAHGREPAHARSMFDAMMRDIRCGGGAPGCPLTHAAYALGYNLAIEYLADYEKRWMLESFRDLDERFVHALGRKIDWTFLEVRLSRGRGPRPLRRVWRRGANVRWRAGACAG